MTVPLLGFARFDHVVGARPPLVGQLRLDEQAALALLL